MTIHTYAAHLEWSGSTGSGYRDYDRAHQVTPAGSAPLALSADPAFRGDGSLPNPEQLLLAAASSCQLLSFLAVAALAKVDVVRYTDSARASMPDDVDPVRITEITLNLNVTARGTDEATVHRLLEEAHRQCYIANTISAPVTIVAQVEIIN